MRKTRSGEASGPDVWEETIQRKAFLEDVKKRRGQNRTYGSGTTWSWERESNDVHHLGNADWGFESSWTATGPRRGVSRNRI